MRAQTRKRSPLPEGVAQVAEWVRHTNDFRQIERRIWFRGVTGYERNGEHTFQLADVAWYLVRQFLPHLDLLTVLQYCLVHDKPETYAGDTPAFQDRNGVHGSPHTHADKKEREHRAVLRLTEEWEKKFPEFIERLEAYERREDEESQFVYALDKFLAILNIVEDGGRTNHLLEVTCEDETAYKRPKIAAHPFIYALYEQYLRYAEEHPDLFFRETTTAAE